jgi:hypothetical protein
MMTSLPDAGDRTKGLSEMPPVSSLLGGEDETQVCLVMANHVLERRSDAVVEVRRSRGKRTECRGLESAEVAPDPGDVPATGIGELSEVAGRASLECV